MANKRNQDHAEIPAISRIYWKYKLGRLQKRDTDLTDPFYPWCKEARTLFVFFIQKKNKGDSSQNWYWGNNGWQYC